MKSVFQIGDRTVGIGQPAFITAEIGLNHDGDSNLARQLIKSAADAKVDAVKFQVFRTDSFISGDIDKAKYQKASLESDETLYEMWQRLELSSDVLYELSKYARKLGVVFYASAFDEESVDLLDELEVPLFKIASGEVSNIPLIQKIAQKQLPIIMSVGMASLGEIEAALKAIRETGNKQVALLHCVANYPTELADVNLRRMEKLQQIFEVPVGYSDHTPSIWASVASVALGAVLLEKHFTHSKDKPGTDHALSADPTEMKAIVEGARAIEAALGSSRLELLETEQKGRTLFRRGLVATKSIPSGAVITSDLVTAKRPAMGIEPMHLETIIGRKVLRDIKAGEHLTWKDI